MTGHHHTSWHELYSQSYGARQNILPLPQHIFFIRNPLSSCTCRHHEKGDHHPDAAGLGQIPQEGPQGGRCRPRSGVDHGDRQGQGPAAGHRRRRGRGPSDQETEEGGRGGRDSAAADAARRHLGVPSAGNVEGRRRRTVPVAVPPASREHSRPRHVPGLRAVAGGQSRRCTVVGRPQASRSGILSQRVQPVLLPRVARCRARRVRGQHLCKRRGAQPPGELLPDDRAAPARRRELAPAPRRGKARLLLDTVAIASIVLVPMFGVSKYFNSELSCSLIHSYFFIEFEFSAQS